MAEDKTYDLIIIGAGPAGLTAAIYAARYQMDCMVISPETGGSCAMAHDIENWPGFKGPGMELMQKFEEHAKSFGVPIRMDEVREIKKESDEFIVSTEKENFKAKTIIIAMGTKRRKLDAPGEDALFGKGVSYCATCDALFFKDKVVGVVGGANAAAMAAQILSQNAKKVYIIYRKSKMRCEPIRLNDLENDPKVEFRYNSNVKEIIGKEKLERVKLDTGEELQLDGLFIEIGGLPITAIAKELGVELSEKERIKVDKSMATNIEGVFAAGDITTGSNGFNQIVTAAAEGAIATLGAFNFIRKR
jgi:thioredoxin reductase (NADPH)